MTANTKLSEKAVLVRLKRHMLYTSRKDLGVSAETTDRKGAASDAGRWTTNFLPKDSMSKITSAYSQVKIAHETYTLPWFGDGTRVCPAAVFDKYMAKVTAAIEYANVVVDEWLRDVYPGLRASAAQRLAGLMTSEINIPSAEEARTKFSIEHDVFPMPDSRGFRCYLGSNLASVTKNADEAVERLMKKAVGDIYQKIQAMLERIVNTLGNKDAKFKNSLIGNLKELCEMIPVLNLNDDPELESIRQVCVKQLTQVQCDTLREDEEARAKTAKKAKAILETVRKIDLDLE